MISKPVEKLNEHDSIYSFVTFLSNTYSCVYPYTVVNEKSGEMQTSYIKPALLWDIAGLSFLHQEF